MADVRAPDRCPGVLRPHHAADGALLRIRLPGGQTTGMAFARLAEIAERFGSGLVQLTSRGSVQLRGIADPVPDEAVRALAEAGFLPSYAHDRSRNVVTSPLTGLAGGLADLRPMTAALDAAILAESTLADLPGRFLFALDDGRGDVSGLDVDLAYVATDNATGWLLAGPDRGVKVGAGDAVALLIGLAADFVRSRGAGGAWRVRELPEWAGRLPRYADAPAPNSGPPAGPPLGAVGEHASVAAPLGRLEPAQVRLLAALAGHGPLVVTPWRAVVVPGAATRLAELAAAGLIVSGDSAWAAVSACVGAPWCAKGRMDTAALVQRVVREHPGHAWPRVHVSACERRCGAPAEGYVDLVAPTPGQLSAAIGARG